jgi:oligoendopeptidase F
MTTAHVLPARRDVIEENRWDLSSLAENDAAWEKDFLTLQERVPDMEAYKGKLGQAIEHLHAMLDCSFSIARLSERLGYYAYLRVAEDASDSAAQARMARYTGIASDYAARASFITPEIQSIPESTMNKWLDHELLHPYRWHLMQLLRYKPHVLSEAEERLLAMQTESAMTARLAFNALNDIDLVFDDVPTPEGLKPLTHASYASFMQHPDRAVRERAYTNLLGAYDTHKHTLVALYNGSVQRDVYEARIRHFPSAMEASLFADHVPADVYTGLIACVHEHLPLLHRYYALRRTKLGLDTLRLFDTRVPLVPDIKTQYSYEEAVDHVVSSLALLGSEYTDTLRHGLLNGRWVDRYENKGKRSGAFSAGSYDGNPYILMNYKEDVLGDMFTLTHEAGHSMHSWYSARHQPFQDYNYTIFVAEVASTFNEQLLARHLTSQTRDTALQAYLLNKQLDDMIGTLFRQTMFAEFEMITHAMVERKEPLTVDSVTEVYRKLLEQYFGPDVPLETISPMEAFRIPHFYSAFYVYKYATGMAAALALSETVIHGGDAERERYLTFLKSGGNAYPLDQLKNAGVDMTTATPLQTAMQTFANYVEAFERVMQ